MVLFLVLVMFSFPAYAYIDAGIGSMVIQVLVAVLMLIPFYFRKIIDLFRKKHTRDDNNE